LSKRPIARGIGPVEGGFDDIDDTQSIDTADDARRGLWSHDEDELLLQAYNEFGPRWPLIASRVPGRNQRQCEKRYRRIKKSQDEFETESLTASPDLNTLAQLASSL
jgi:hypothetical protein